MLFIPFNRNEQSNHLNVEFIGYPLQGAGRRGIERA
jgi:hypothetical protein